MLAIKGGSFDHCGAVVLVLCTVSLTVGAMGGCSVLGLGMGGVGRSALLFELM